MATNIKNFAGESIRRLDFHLLSRFRLVRELRAAAPDAGADARPAEDWSRARRARTEPFDATADRYASDDSYRRYLAAIHDSKIRAAFSLIEQFDFSRQRRIIELGCGDMPQAYVLCEKFPQIAYTATDFDPHVIEKCSALPLLSGIRKRVLDVNGADLDELRNHDLVISWSLEFALDDAQLTRLFATCRRHARPYLLNSHTAVGPLGFLAHAWDERGHARGGRRLGWLRSIGEIERLAGTAGMVLQWKAYHVNHVALYFSTA